MRKMFMAILALAGVSSLFMPVRVFAQNTDGMVQEMIPETRAVSRAARLRTAQDPDATADPDTIWIGHIYDPTFTAINHGGNPTMPAGGYGPYHVGRGPNFPKRAGSPVTIGDNGTWDFDRFQAGENDSLQGWWPVARSYQSGATTFGDFRRAFQGLDYGNQVNYVINQGAPKRTFGVVGLWHRDKGNTALAPGDTVAGSNVQNCGWSPTEVGGAGSTASCWMGLRSHGDLSAIDLLANGGTGNAFNGDLLQYQGNNGFNQAGSIATNGTDHNFPGYGSQMDQILYRDINSPSGSLVISFNFSTNMSRIKNTTVGAEVGWFDKDPISNAQSGVGAGATPTSDGNFISASVAGATNGPVDSFMVYIGAPVNDNNVTFSSPLFVGVNEITTVYDKKRRWFSEVLRCTAGDAHYKELVSASGHNDPTPVSINVSTLYATELADIRSAGGGVVRLVFRVKTNRGFDDENAGNPSSAHDSGTRGAAIIDNVVWTGQATAAEGNFENATGAGAINNDTAVSAVNAWKSTGKPPAVYFHVHSVNTLAFNDPCGGLDNVNRQCNLYGKVLTAGDHDVASDKEGGIFGSNTQDRQRWAVSPTINLKSNGNGVGNYNAMGVDQEIADASGDYIGFFSLFNGGLVNATTNTGNFLSVGYQSYPARQINGNICWGEARHTTAISFYGTRGCFETFFTGAKTNSLIRTTNAANTPDSLRLYLHRIQRCYSFTGLTNATCSPTTGTDVGIYFDNVSMCLYDAAAPPGISIPIWMLINDAFPANGNDALIPAGFDTCAAQIRIGLNNAAATGTTGRPCITGDSVVVTAAGAGKRLDMVFRIKPGVGNYVTKGVRSSGVSRRPDAAVPVAATPGDGSYFGTYMANTGEFGSQSAHPSGGTVWGEWVWNSARMDTIENNLFPTANNTSVVGLAAGSYAGMRHESDPKFATLGITKNRCVMPSPTGATTSANMACDGTGWGAYGAGSGWDGVTTTKEYTKIIPDGLLTPGAHVEYFFRKSDAATGLTAIEYGPDTNYVFQGTEGSNDGHRWQEFSVLPDRWKDSQWALADRDAPAPACMLYIDWEDRRGDERFWVGIADTIGATAGSYVAGKPSGRWGAHNGWHARGDQDLAVLDDGTISLNQSIAVYSHGGQPGTLWDMYGVKASESSTTSGSLGSRTTTDPAGFQTGKKALNGPSGLMLRQYYRVLLILTGDLNAGNIGPYIDKGDNDVALLQDFANATAGGLGQPRGVWAQGRGFVEGQVTGGASGHPTFPTTYFGAGLASGDYRSYAGNANDVPDLFTFAPVHALVAPEVGSPRTYGVLSSCVITDDVLTTSGTFGAAMAAKYEDSGTNPNPKIASIYAPSSLPATTHPMLTVVDGFRVQSLGTRATLQTGGLMLYYWETLVNAFGSINCTVSSGQPVGVGDLPNGNGALVNFLALRSENPYRGRDMAKIVFGITRKEKVELKVYDVTGRLVRTLANREFEAGSHDLFWDGSNDDGQSVARGVYFYQLRTPSFVSQKKLAVLKN